MTSIQACIFFVFSCVRTLWTVELPDETVTIRPSSISTSTETSSLQTSAEVIISNPAAFLLPGINLTTIASYLYVRVSREWCRIRHIDTANCSATESAPCRPLPQISLRLLNNLAYGHCSPTTTYSCDEHNKYKVITNLPRYVLDTHVTTIPPSTPVSTTVFSCVAEDRDTRAPFNTITYEMVLMANNAGAFFDVRPNGDIVLTQSVLNDNENQYQVRLLMYYKVFSGIFKTSNVWLGNWCIVKLPMSHDI